MVSEVKTVAKPQGEEEHHGGREADEAKKDYPSDCLASPALGEMNYAHALCPALCHHMRKTNTSLGRAWACELLFRRTAPIGRPQRHEPH